LIKLIFKQDTTFSGDIPMIKTIDVSTPAKLLAIYFVYVSWPN
jgi:hypothetical protein